VAVVTAQMEWASHRCVPWGKRSHSSLRLSSVNLDSRVSYRHGGRGPLPTDPVITPPFKALTGEAPRTRSLTEPLVLRSTQQTHLMGTPPLSLLWPPRSRPWMDGWRRKEMSPAKAHGRGGATAKVLWVCVCVVLLEI
jgi:hypothetical protein